MDVYEFQRLGDFRCRLIRTPAGVMVEWLGTVVGGHHEGWHRDDEVSGSSLAEEALQLAEEKVALTEENRRLREGAELVLAGFESGVFVRDISKDSEPGWAMKMIEPLRGLGILSREIKGA